MLYPRYALGLLQSAAQELSELALEYLPVVTTFLKLIFEPM